MNLENIYSEDKKLMKKACLACDSSNCYHKTGCVIKLEGGGELVISNYVWEIGYNPDEERDYAIHAEARAISVCANAGQKSKGASLYVTRFPCKVCSRLIVEAGISKVYYMNPTISEGTSAREFLNKNNVEVIQISEELVWDR